MPELAIDTRPLLRPTQLKNAIDEKSSLEKKLNNPNIQDKGEVAKQLRRLDVQLREQTPAPFAGPDKDMAVRFEEELRGQILQGMPSHEEMRKNPPGAVEKHIDWEKRNKVKLQMWKNVRLRLNAGTEDDSVANFEKFRPRTSTLNMDSAQVTGSMHFLPPPGVAPSVVFTDEQLAAIRLIDPELLGSLALLDNEQRASVKSALLEAVGKRPAGG